MITVNLAGCRRGPDGYLRSSYDARDVDAIGVYCEELDRCFLLPIGDFAGMRAVSLRLEPARNRQKAAINWAAHYDLQGAVAQLEERCRGTAEVTGSSPVSSTSECHVEAVGAHEFRNRFGLFMERAHAGERFMVIAAAHPTSYSYRRPSRSDSASRCPTGCLRTLTANYRFARKAE